MGVCLQNDKSRAAGYSTVLLFTVGRHRNKGPSCGRYLASACAVNINDLLKGIRK
jgi:hypothetical protein